MTLLDDIDAMAALEVADYRAGGYEPDGAALVLGVQVADDPAQLGYGTDLSCTDDCDATMSEVDALSPEAVGQALIRRLSTAHGRLIDDPELLVAVGEDPDYGYNLANMLHVDVTPLELAAKADLAAAECKKDDRVETCTVTITRIAGSTFDVKIFGVLRTGAAYSATLPLTDAAAVLRAEELV